jgi:hypothetical protein
MRGEFIGVWSETWREIWLPLVEQSLSNEEDIPADIFCELYRELASAVKEPIGEHALDGPLNDAVQLREAFERTLILAGITIEFQRAREAFDASNASELVEASARRAAAEGALAPLLGDTARASELFSRALAELASDPKKRAQAKERALDLVINDPMASRQAFEAIATHQLLGEPALVGFLEAAHPTLNDLAGDELSNRYFNLLSGFIEKFSLRYDLRRPCVLCPTLPGVFASLVRDLRRLTSQDTRLDQFMKDYEDAVRDLRFGCTDSRIKTCIGKQFMLIEAIGAFDPSVTKNTLGDMCDQLNSWPHATIREALKKLYGFSSDYPGIRHAGSPKGALRGIEMRDMVAMSILLTGFTPYLESRLSADAIYGGSLMNVAPVVAAQSLPNANTGNPDAASQPRGFFGRLLRRVIGGDL